MENIEMKRDGDILTITVDLSKKGDLTSTGKSHKIANSEGWSPILDAQEGFKLSMLLIQKVKK